MQFFLDRHPTLKCLFLCGFQNLQREIYKFHHQSEIVFLFNQLLLFLNFEILIFHSFWEAISNSFILFDIYIWKVFIPFTMQAFHINFHIIKGKKIRICFSCKKKNMPDLTVSRYPSKIIILL